MKKILIIFALFLAHGTFAQNQSHSKSSAQQASIQTINSKHKSIGTFIVINSSGNGNKLLMTEELLNEIDLKREISTDSFITISSDIKIKIFSKDAISSPNFVPNH